METQGPPNISFNQIQSQIIKFEIIVGGWEDALADETQRYTNEKGYWYFHFVDLLLILLVCLVLGIMEYGMNVSEW